MIQILVWWLIMQVLGWLALPTSMRIFRWLPDRGYAFSKALGLLLVSYFLWVGASTTLLSNDLGGILFSILLLAALSTWFYFRCRGNLVPELRSFLREKIKLVITVETLFALALVAWAVMRAYAPFKIEPQGGEKFMETAFQNAILRSEHFPPLDPWLSGFAISYYYYGFVMMAMLTHLSGAISGVGFDLYDSLLFALTLVGSFGVVYNLVAFTIKSRHKERDVDVSPGPPIMAGVLGGLLVTIMGNLEGVLEALHARGILSASFWTWIDIPDLASASVTGSWYPGNIFLWWWRASRVISDKDFFGNVIGASPIDEFPAFSFILGDNHPHVLALPFVLMAIGVALNIFIRQLQKSEVEPGEDEESASESHAPWWNPVAFALDNDWLLFIFSALILGSLGFLNTWDLPIYLGVIVLAYGLAQAMVRARLDRETIARSIVLGLGLGILSGILYIFFYVSFSSQASGVLPYVFPPTRLVQYLVMFGTFMFLLSCFLLISLHKRAQRDEDKTRLWKSALVWWLRLLLICLGLFLLILLLIGLVLFVIKPAPDTTLGATISMVLGGLSLRQAFATSLVDRLRDPWLVLLLTALLAMALANVGSLLRQHEGSAGSAEERDDSSDTLNADAFVYLLIFTGIALTLIVEFLYLRDSFGVRMNTVFKFYYQGWVMMGIASAYGVWWLLDRLQKQAGRVLFTVGAALMIAFGLLYTAMAYPSRAGEFAGSANLDGASSIAQANTDDWAAIQWLDANAEKGLPTGTVPVILEAPSYTISGTAYVGGSYTYFGRISTFTGFPTLLGWASHEAQWRGNYAEQDRREPIIASIYTTSDAQAMLDLLHEWDVSYVILGQTEMNYIQSLCSLSQWHCTASMALRKFNLVLQPVFSQGQVTIYKVP